MIEAHEVAVLMKAVGNVVKEYVTAALAVVTGKVDQLEQRLKEIPAGPRGEKGDPGQNGKDGAPGERGATGEAIKGDAGPIGPQGERGPAGIDGKDGAAGPIGPTGPAGNTGEKGIDGKDGRDGREGKDGRDGTPGRDALQIDILPAIDPAKSYPRGTFAKYAGGLLRANCNTTAGDAAIRSEWDVIIEGIAGTEFKRSDDLRGFTFEVRLTSGSTLHRFSMAALIYRGIFKDGEEYSQGDVVTWGGSLWHCNAESTKAKPGVGSSDWQLCVKEGRAGKDGMPGKDGERGPEGKAGRDLTQVSYGGQR